MISGDWRSQVQLSFLLQLPGVPHKCTDMRGFGDQPIGRESSSWPRHRRRASVSASGNSASQFVSVRSRSGAIRRLQSTLPPIPLSRQRCRRGGWAVGGACVCLPATVGRVRELITDAATHKHAPADVLDKRANQTGHTLAPPLSAHRPSSADHTNWPRCMPASSVIIVRLRPLRRQTNILVNHTLHYLYTDFYRY